MLIGLDIGGTKIEGILLDSEHFELHKKYRLPTPKTGYVDFVDTVMEVINHLAENESVSSIGIGCCGSINEQSGLMQSANILYLNGKNFIRDIQEQVDWPVAMSNDANCLAISEFKSGAAKQAHSSCLAIIIGTGCGSGIIIKNDEVTGLNNLGGEIGHNPLPGYTPSIDGASVDCYCGSVNCIESFCSGTGFERTYAEKHPKLKAKDIFESAEKGNTSALAHIELYCDQLARVIASVVNIIDPEIVVLGGGMSNQDRIYPLVNDKLNQYTFSKSVVTKVVKAHHGDSSGVRGAAILPLLKKLI